MPWRDPLPDDGGATELGLESMGRLVRRLRHRAGWTQRQLEARSGVHQSVICRLEQGQRCGISWRRFAALIGTLGGVDPPPDPPPLPWPGISGRAHDPSDFEGS